MNTHLLEFPIRDSERRLVFAQYSSRCDTDVESSLPIPDSLSKSAYGLLQGSSLSFDGRLSSDEWQRSTYLITHVALYVHELS